MPDIKDLLEQLASNPMTSPGLLRQLSIEDRDLLPIIAQNPNCSQELLDNLAFTNPQEVLSNPRFLFNEIRRGDNCTGFSLKSLVSLCMSCDPSEHAGLIDETRSVIAEGIEVLQEQDQASLSCVWLYERAFTLSPNECKNIIGDAIDFEFRVKAQMNGSGSMSVAKLPGFGDDAQIDKAEMRQDLKLFLSAISSGSLEEYFDPDICLEDSGAAEMDIEAVNLPQGLSLQDEILRRVHPPDEDHDEWEEYLLAFEHEYSESLNPVRFRDDYCLVVPVVYINAIEHAYDISMGELGDLIGLKIHCSKAGLELDWPSRLAELLIP
jgi:hypothetical protein